ncbi:MAG: hypothetical protein IJD33_05720, partial [Clostridia bacterium]|nr:hypothetical protein [Clostridia bacterium]
YPIMASVEYAVKYLRNADLENRVKAFVGGCDRVYCGGDWTKVCAVFGDNAFAAAKDAESAGLYAEFCDGNVVTFYLSPATKTEDFERLTAFLQEAFQKYPLLKDIDKNDVDCDTSPTVLPKNRQTEWVDIDDVAGRICARTCGLFPPCTPLLKIGERITEEKLALIRRADNVFGLREGKIEVFENE